MYGLDTLKPIADKDVTFLYLEILHLLFIRDLNKKGCPKIKISGKFTKETCNGFNKPAFYKAIFIYIKINTHTHKQTLRQLLDKEANDINK